jgi:hypothetical protein
METGQDDQFVLADDVHHPIRKAPQRRTPDSLLDHLIHEGIFLDRVGRVPIEARSK